MSPHYIICIASLLILASGVTAKPSPSLFPETAQVEDATYYKMGEHRNVYKVFFKVYDAALFTEPEATPEDVLSRDCAFHLEFRYLRNIPKSAILESAERMLHRNLTTETRRRLKAPIEKLHATYRSVIVGDVSTLTYTPEKGTTFAINGDPLITIPGQEFAQSYLEIWFGTLPISLELRDRLLSR